MKEFVEKLIGRLEELRTCSDFGTCNHCQNRWCPMELLEADEVIKIVNKLAEEYNNEVCEWSKQGGYNFYLHKTSCGTEDTFDDSYVFCPYCGKKIKVVK